MLFMYIHTHSPERCTIDKPAETLKMLADGQAAAKKAGIKWVGGWAAPHQHTMFVVFDTDDIAALEKVLAPMTLWGDAELIPLVTSEQLFGPAKK
jgi:hypothetical protein